MSVISTCSESAKLNPGSETIYRVAPDRPYGTARSIISDSGDNDDGSDVIMVLSSAKRGMTVHIRSLDACWVKSATLASQSHAYRHHAGLPPDANAQSSSYDSRVEHDERRRQAASVSDSGRSEAGATTRSVKDLSSSRLRVRAHKLLHHLRQLQTKASNN